MPPRKADKSRHHESTKAPHNFQVTREPLAAADPPEEIPLEDWGRHGPHVTDALFPEWTVDALEGEDWFSANDLFVDDNFGTQALPYWLRAETAGWVRAREFIQGKNNSQCDDLIADQKGGEENVTKLKNEETGQSNSQWLRGRFIPACHLASRNAHWGYSWGRDSRP